MKTRSRPRSWLFAPVLLLTAACLTGLPAGAVAQDEVQRGGTLIVAADGAAFPTNLNPAINTSNGAVYISGKVVETLAEMGVDGLEPRLATSWEGSDDGLSFTVNLREGVTFSDGAAVHLRGRQVLGGGGLEGRPEPRTVRAGQPRDASRRPTR